MTDAPPGRASTTTGGPGQADAARPGPAVASPGWYPDPWSGAHHRYWNGTSWTGDSFPHGPRGEDQSAVVGTPPPIDTADTGTPSDTAATGTAAAGTAATESQSWAGVRPRRSPSGPTPPPPQWSRPVEDTSWNRAWPGPTTPTPVAPGPSGGFPTGAALVALVVVTVLIVGSLGVVGGYFTLAKRAKSTAVATGPTPGNQTTVPARPADPAASLLAGLVIRQSDVDAGVTVQPLVGGTRVADEPTLDVCNGTFQSEALRTARLQVAARDSQGVTALSTEAVLYRGSAGSGQAFSELQARVAGCPTTPVVSPVGEPTVTTHFNPAPDSAWPQVPTVTRLALDFVTSDDLGTKIHSVAVYLRRGRALMGVYFAHPDAAPVTVAGQSTIDAVTNVFAARMAQLPASAVGA